VLRGVLPARPSRPNHKTIKSSNRRLPQR
jgi:hypothetical protein